MTGQSTICTKQKFKQMNGTYDENIRKENKEY